MSQISTNIATQKLPDIFTKNTIRQSPDFVYEFRTGAYAEYNEQTETFHTITRAETPTENSIWVTDAHGDTIKINKYNDVLCHIEDDEYDIIRVFTRNGEKLHKIFERPDIERKQTLCLTANEKTTNENMTKITYFLPIKTDTNIESITAHTTNEVMELVKKLTEKAKPDTRKRICTAVETILPCMEHISTIQMTFPDSRIDISIISTITTTEKKED